jgi:hypothetical protein
LGSQPGNPDVHSKYIASLSPDAATREEEVAAIGIESVEKSAMTIFPKENDRPFLYDYQMKGFFKDACSSLSRVGVDKSIPKAERPKGSTKSAKLEAYRKVIDGLIFVFPRKCFFVLSGPMGQCQRPIRVDTPQGPRVALANSETIPAGSTVEMEVRLLDTGHDGVVREWLDYGALRGLGQWRNSSKGRFTWEELT